MHVLSSHNNRVYRDHPVTCTFEPPTRNLYSSESGDSDARCSGVIALFARPLNHAPTMYAAPVSSPYTTYEAHESATRLTTRRPAMSKGSTHTCQQHQIVICLKVSRPNHDPSRRGSKCNDNDGYRQECKRLRDKVTHGDGGRECWFNNRRGRFNTVLLSSSERKEFQAPTAAGCTQIKEKCQALRLGQGIDGRPAAVTATD